MGRPIVETTEDYITEAAVAGSATKLVPANSVALVVRSSILDRLLPTALVPIPITLNQDMKAVVTHEGVLPGYLAHLLRSLGPELLRAVRKTGASVSSLEVPKLLSYRVPVPPVVIQKELVRILDKMMALQAELEAKLEAELEGRSRQYVYYRDSVLSFRGRSDVRWLPLGQIGQFHRGRRFTKADYALEGIPCIHYGEIYTDYGTSARSVVSHLRPDLDTTLRFAEHGDVVVVDVGETVEDVGKAVAWLGHDPVAIHDHSYAFRHQMNPAFVSYCMQTASFRAEKGKYVARTKVKTLLVAGFAKIAIPVPPMAEQRRIVAILDKFDSLVDDLSISLSAEIKASRRKYEYYRDKLLSFEEAA
jgi:type I restriction enzyme S subunit